MSECTCHLSHPSYAGFIGNHSPMCPANREPKHNCTPDLLKQLEKKSPPAPERISEEDFYEHNAIDPEQTIRNAFNQIWKRATNQPYEAGDRSLMSIPPDERRDADFIMHRALDELFYLRKITKLGAK